MDLDILECKVVVGEIESLADDDTAFFTSIILCDAFVIDLLSCELVLAADTDLRAFAVDLTSLFAQLILKLVNFSLE